MTSEGGAAPLRTPAEAAAKPRLGVDHAGVCGQGSIGCMHHGDMLQVDPVTRVRRAMSRSRLREFLETARLRGARLTVRALFRRFLFSYQRAYLFWNPLVAWAEPMDDDPFEYHLATRDDLDRLTVFEAYVVRSRMRRWLESEGTWVFLALDGDRPVAFECNSTAPPPDPMLPPIALATHQVWTTEIYVLPEYRRRHVSLGLRRYRNRVVRTWGFDEVVSKVDGDNYASLKRVLSVLAPSGRVRRVTCLCVLGLHCRWVDEDARPMLERHLFRMDSGGGRAGRDALDLEGRCASAMRAGSASEARTVKE